MNKQQRLKQLEAKLLSRTATDEEHIEYNTIKVELENEGTPRLNELLAKIKLGQATNEECDEYDRLRIEKKRKKLGN